MINKILTKNNINIHLINTPQGGLYVTSSGKHD
ncbi:hypothetical protein PEC301879_22450 [Pectobacterium carotovorum subsp. carotovorum]|nr:hypothetical protein PEC301879_22450 [Pectobacterium carotovorum subsp. carotovorum]